MNDRALRAASRRLRFRSRSVAVSIALVVVILAAGWLGTEAMLAALGRAPLSWAPADVAAIAGSGAPVAIGIGAGLAVAGAIAVILAVSPGRRARHELADDRVAIVIDDEVLASGISRAAARAASVSPGQVRTSVSRRTATSRVRPVTGYPPDGDRATDAARGVVDRLAPQPSMRTTVAIEKTGALA